MKARKLNSQELTEINGGSNDAMSSGVGIDLGTGSILTLNYQWSQGDKSYSSTTEIGKDTHVNLDILNLNTD
ncbi:hypothetical protein [Mucilaginibacter ginkgonis]|uniref:Bacteriocin-like protein n=1 Tax=Mucilaginibacter ginkgonis TaxID=2682091 RepID=A0A6I4IMF1_9SPHI|nr:hypothetical protein [Mucilaginibacter ginkgonis]QQL50456.1 hypothetical protein GO620_003090 [Mucilaginibacter ginkgonis]